MLPPFVVSTLSRRVLNLTNNVPRFEPFCQGFGESLGKSLEREEKIDIYSLKDIIILVTMRS